MSTGIDDRDVVRRRAQPGGDRRDRAGPGIVQRRERQPVAPTDGDPLVADLPEQPPRTLGERLPLEPGERLRRAEAAARAADEQDPGQLAIRHGSV